MGFDTISVAQARQIPAVGQAVMLQGWIRTRRDSKGGFSFLELNDGSCLANIQIVADANQGWSEEEALTFVGGIDGTILGLLEQPTKADDFASLRRIRAASPIPLSADESVVTSDDALRLSCLQAVDVLSIKASKNGGITKSLRIIAIAEAAQMQCRMNSMLEFGVTQAALLHLGAVTGQIIPSGHAYMSTLRMSDDFTDFSARLHDGYAHIADAPGLGITVDAEKLARHASERFVVS